MTGCRWRPCRWIAPLMAFTLAAAAPHRAAAVRPATFAAADTVADDDEFQEVLVELRFGRLLARTITAYRLDDAALLPLPDFFRLAEIRYDTDGDSAITAILQPGSRRVRIALGASTVAVDGRIEPLDPGALILRGGVLYLATAPLGRILGLRMVADWSEVYVAVENPKSLPLVRRLERAAARRAMERSAGPIEADWSVRAPRAGVNGMVVDYAWILPGDDPLAGSNLILSAGSNVLGGSLELETQSRGRVSTGQFQVNGLWTGVWPDNPRVRQFRLGDGVATGPRARAIRGVAVTNVPWIRTPAFGSATFAGSLPAGWEVEAYRQGQLVAYDSVGGLGRFAFDLPVERGENPVELVAYGPYGEVRRFNQTYRVDREILLPGKLEYGVSGGQCRAGRCNAMANADVRYGVSRRLTVGAGVDQFWRGDAGDLGHPYASVLASPMNALSLEGEAALNAFARGAVRFEPSLDLRLSAEVTAYSQAIANPIITPLGTRSRTTLLGFLRPVARLRSFYFTAQLDHVALTDGSLTTARVGAAGRLHPVTLIPYLRWQDRAGTAERTAFAGTDAILLPQRRWGPVFDGLSARATLEMADDASLSVVAANLAYNVRTGTRIEGGLRWLGNGRGTALTLGISSTLGNVSSDLSVSAPSTGPAVTTTSFRGSAIYNEASGRISLSPLNSIQRSGVTGVVFLDENTNGLQDPGEPGIPDVRVIIGFGTVRTDSAGRYEAWDAAPYQAVLVAVDSLSLPNPLWVSQYGAVRAEPGPNTYTTVNLPIVASAVIEGSARLRRPGTAETVPAGHLALVLVERRTGTRIPVTTFSDGGFYLMGVRPGRYTLTVDDLSATRVRVVTPVTLDVESLPGGAVLDGVELTVTPIGAP